MNLGIFPFNADAVDFNKIVRTDPDLPDEEHQISEIGKGFLEELKAQFWDISRDSDDDENVPADNVIELDGESYTISDAQIEIVNEGVSPQSFVAEALEEDDAIDTRTRYISPSDSCNEPKNVRLVEKTESVFQLLENSCIRKTVKIGQRKPRIRVERACIPSSSMNIDAKKKIIALKAKKEAEIKEKKLLREKKREEKLTAKKRSRCAERRNSLVDLRNTPLISTASEISDESTAESTPPTTPKKTKRIKINHQKKRILRIMSTDSEEQ